MLDRMPLVRHSPSSPSFDLETLRTFVIIVETGSFTRAGEIVGRSQSAVSMQMQRLADLAGGQIIKKVQNTLHLTRRGRCCMPMRSVYWR